MTKEKDFEFSYQGSNYIDVNTLLASQFHFVASLAELQKELFPDVEIKLKLQLLMKAVLLFRCLWKQTSCSIFLQKKMLA
jgi:hypothetical protein